MLCLLHKRQHPKTTVDHGMLWVGGNGSGGRGKRGLFFRDILGADILAQV